MTKIPCCLFASFFALASAHSVQALDLVLRPSEVLDLARAPKGTREFAFDKVTLSDQSVIMIPSSFKSVKLTINDLRSTGTPYIVVYDDEVIAEAPAPLKTPRAGVCTTGSAGQVGVAGGARHKVRLNLAIGFLNIDRIVILSEGLQGIPGGKGGNGQDGGDSGGRERCLVNPCDGGNGGANGLGGPGGPGGDGGDVVVDFSGIPKDAIHTSTDRGAYFAALITNLSTGSDIQEKLVGEHTNSGGGFLTLVAGVGQAKALSIRGPLSRIEYDPGVHIVASPGNGGSPGLNGDLTGGGGAGYDCTFGRNQSGGRPGVVNFSANTEGPPGQPGIITLNKLD